ncbi:uncharacterized protein METZ01_LOCUS469716, partial [marine metagenome]
HAASARKRLHRGRIRHPHGLFRPPPAHAAVFLPATSHRRPDVPRHQRPQLGEHLLHLRHSRHCRDLPDLLLQHRHDVHHRLAAGSARADPSAASQPPHHPHGRPRSDALQGDSGTVRTYQQLRAGEPVRHPRGQGLRPDPRADARLRRAQRRLPGDEPLPHPRPGCVPSTLLPHRLDGAGSEPVAGRQGGHRRATGYGRLRRLQRLLDPAHTPHRLHGLGHRPFPTGSGVHASHRRDHGHRAGHRRP